MQSLIEKKTASVRAPPISWRILETACVASTSPAEIEKLSARRLGRHQYLRPDCLLAALQPLAVLVFARVSAALRGGRERRSSFPARRQRKLTQNHPSRRNHIFRHRPFSAHAARDDPRLSYLERALAYALRNSLYASAANLQGTSWLDVSCTRPRTPLCSLVTPIHSDS